MRATAWSQPTGVDSSTYSMRGYLRVQTYRNGSLRCALFPVCLSPDAATHFDAPVPPPGGTENGPRVPTGRINYD